MILAPFGFIGSGINYAPIALDAIGNTYGYQFTAKWKQNPSVPPSSYTGTYSIDVFLASDMSYVGSFHNLSVSDTQVIVDGLTGQIQYKYWVRAALTQVVIPQFRTSWPATYTVTDTSSPSDIQDAIDSITVPAGEYYRLDIPFGITSPTSSIQTKRGLDIFVAAGVDLGWTGSTAFAQDTWLTPGDHMLVFESNATENSWRETNLHPGHPEQDFHAYPLRFWQNVPGDFILVNANFRAKGTDSAAGLEIDFANPGSRVFLINCKFRSETNWAANFHNNTGGFGQLIISNSDFICDNPIRDGIGVTNFNSIGGQDGFIYVKGGNVGNIGEGNGTGGAGETKIYIDPSTVHGTITAANPSCFLNLADFTDFITTNNLYLSDYSNVTTVTTPAEAYPFQYGRVARRRADSVTLVGGDVDVAIDLFGNGYDATANSVGERPAVLANWNNGKPAFSCSADLMTHTEITLQDFTLIIIGNTDSNADDNVIYSHSGGGFSAVYAGFSVGGVSGLGCFGINTTGSPAAIANVTLGNAVAPTTAKKIIIVTRDSTGTTAYINGVATPKVNNSQRPLIIDRFIGYAGSSASSLKGSLVEDGIYSRAFNAAEAANAYSQLKTYYGL